MTRGNGRDAGINGHFPKPRPAFNPAFKLPWIDPTSLQDKPVPEREWLVDGLIPARAVTMLSGDGGLGKSLLAMQLMTCCAIDRPWLGRETSAVRSLGIFCEDDADEIHYRQDAINKHYECNFRDLVDCRWLSRVGNENTLVNFITRYEDGERREEFEETYLVAHISNAAREFGAQLIVLDSLHDLFGGNENSRQHARQFIQTLRELAISINGAVVLPAHPSLSGMSSGTGAAGSTAWNNAVRSRLYLTKPKQEEGEPEDRDSRVLKTMKSNYGATGDEINLRYENGVFVPQQQISDTPSDMVGRIEVSNFEKSILDAVRKLNDQGTTISLGSRAGNYAPKVIKRMSGFGGADFRKLAQAVERMSANGILVEDMSRRGENRHAIKTVIVRTDQHA